MTTKSERFRLLYVLFFSLPFTHGMTLDIGFNIKIYELISALFFGFFISSTMYRNMLSYKTNYKNLYVSFIIFFLLYLVSNLIATYYFSLNYFDYVWSVGRFAPYINTILPIIYLFLVLFVVFYLLENTNRRLFFKFIDYWLLGAFVSSLYLIYSNIAIYTPLPEVILLGAETIDYSSFFNGMVFAREGTFSEGGFLSGYLVASIILLHIKYIKKRRFIYYVFALYLICSLLLTMSTGGIVVLFIYFNIYYILNIIYFRKRSALYKLLYVYLLIFFLIFFSPLSNFLFEIVYLKIFSEDINTSAMAYSKFDRLYHLDKGFELFMENKYFGVGSYNFGFYFPLIADSNIFSDGTDYKKIINNIYVQILAENGIFVFLSFVSIFFLIARKFVIKKRKTLLDISSISFLIAILVKWLAYPTYLLMYDWVSISLIVFVIWSRNDLCKR